MTQTFEEIIDSGVPKYVKQLEEQLLNMLHKQIRQAGIGHRRDVTAKITLDLDAHLQYEIGPV